MSENKEVVELDREKRHKQEEVVEDDVKERKLSGILVKIFFIGIIIFIVVYLCLRYIGTSFIQTNEFTISDNIPLSFHGVKILHFSDLLYGSTINKNDLETLTKEFKKINPDIVIFTGDIVDPKYNLNNNDEDLLNDFFKNINYTIGKYYVLGENDKNIDDIFNNTNFNYLDNEYNLIYNGTNECIALLGFNSNNIKDISTEKIENYYKISIIHNFDKYNQNIQSNLVLAGHNLNGEIYLGTPWLGDNKYDERFYQINNMDVYISNGLGSIHKLRLFNHPSINVYRLKKN